MHEPTAPAMAEQPSVASPTSSSKSTVPTQKSGSRSGSPDSGIGSGTPPMSPPSHQKDDQSKKRISTAMSDHAMSVSRQHFSDRGGRDCADIHPVYNHIQPVYNQSVQPVYNPSVQPVYNNQSVQPVYNNQSVQPVYNNQSVQPVYNNNQSVQPCPVPAASWGVQNQRDENLGQSRQHSSSDFNSSVASYFNIQAQYDRVHHPIPAAPTALRAQREREEKSQQSITAMSNQQRLSGPYPVHSSVQQPDSFPASSAWRDQNQAGRSQASIISSHGPCPTYMAPQPAAFNSSHCGWQTVNGTYSGLHMTGPHSVDDEAMNGKTTMNGGSEALDLSTGNARKGNQPGPIRSPQAHGLGEQLVNRLMPRVAVPRDNSQLPDSATSSGLCSEGPTTFHGLCSEGPDALRVHSDLPISQRESPMVQSGSRVVQRGSPIGQRGSPIGQRGSPIGQRGSPIDQRGSPIDQRDQSWGEVSPTAWDVAQFNGAAGINIRAAQNNFILSHPHDIPQQPDVMATSASLPSSMPFSPVSSTAAVINASTQNAIQSTSPFQDVEFSNGVDNLVQMGNQFTEGRFALGGPPMMPASLALSINSGLYDSSVSSQLSMYNSQLNARKRRQEQQRDRRDKELSTCRTTSSATVTSAGTSSDGEDTEGKKAKTVPDEKKDDAYWERRRKNNEAAKRSRDARRQKEEEIALRASYLEQENLKLRAQVAILKNETAKLHYLLYNRRQ